ncbi:MAG: LutB/LldF family L-lactate oxidation iron-sulfur protein [Desulfobacterales bacterium]|nr:LutB/LldF family L-lactate oxidation iron-sulfur protein [Desulfobacterales bacterium]
MTPEEFDRKAEAALADSQLRRNFAFAMGSFITRRQALFSDPAETERLRSLGQAVKRRVLSRLPELLEELEANCRKNGIQVHWAETPAVGNRLVLDIIERHAATRVVKGKSMVSEEMHLNAFLETHGIEVVETDLGEFIIQLNGETPSHIIVPAIHKNKQQIARIFHEKVPGAPYTEEVTELNAIARRTLRRKFAEAAVGVSGVNFAVAETGTLCLVENEGNGRMCTTLPPVHIAVMGIEKVLEKMEDLPPLLRLLTGSATGQRITTYVNLISSPRRPGEKDGPHEVHLILLDELRQTLQCVRCGTCLNHCPVYTRIGGHAYGFVYPGPIGKILNPQVAGLDQAGALTTASSLCGACEEVCPVKIPITALLRRLRNEATSPAAASPVPGHGCRRSRAELLAWKGWAYLNTHPRLNRALNRLLGLIGNEIPPAGPIERWTRFREPPHFERTPLHRRVETMGDGDD